MSSTTTAQPKKSALIRLIKSIKKELWKRQKPRLYREFYSQYLKPGDLCFDIGAHMGSRVQPFVELGAQVIALEPQPYCLRKLTRKYGSYPQVTLVPKAVGAELGKTTLYICGNPSMSSISQEFVTQLQEKFPKESWREAHEVEVTTLDSLIAEFGLPVFCKIDVEGFELQVIQGLSQPIQAISFEYHPFSIEEALKCIQHLGTLGDYEFNYSEDETMRLFLNQWIPQDEMEILAFETLSKSPASFGDIYARLV